MTEAASWRIDAFACALPIGYLFNAILIAQTLIP
jgi:hypothetical protein